MITNLKTMFRYDPDKPRLFLIEVKDAFDLQKDPVIGYYGNLADAIRGSERWMKECRSEKVFQSIEELPMCYYRAWLSGTEYIAIKAVYPLQD